MFATQSLVSSQRRFAQKKAIASIDKVRGETVIYFLALIFLVLLCSLFYIWSRIQIVNAGYAINKEVSLKEQLMEENKRLILEGAVLRSPIRLEKLAKNEYQMSLPEETQVLNQTDFKPVEREQKVSQKKETHRPFVVSSSSNKKIKEQKPLKLVAVKKPSSKTDLLKDSRVEKRNEQKLKALRSEVMVKTNKKLM